MGDTATVYADSCEQLFNIYPSPIRMWSVHIWQLPAAREFTFRAAKFWQRTLRQKTRSRTYQAAIPRQQTQLPPATKQSEAERGE